MKRLLPIVFALLFVVAVGTQAVSETRCKGNPQVVAECYSVHGRATFGNGTPALRIWPIGTKRMLGVTAGPVADDADDPICPDSMLKFSPDIEGIYGDFEVCPFTPERKGEMQMVCVESASKLIVKRYTPSR